MRSARGFTLLELMITIAIIGVLATLSYAGYESSLERSNFRSMQEAGIELALKQQMHRQRFGSYAKKIADSGNTAADLLVMPSASDYKITITSADFRGFVAKVEPRQDDLKRLPADCKVLLVTSDMGNQRFGSTSENGNDTSSTCIPHG